ncbi:MAG: hypothetical protein D4R64_02910 [Porphyromonadaceae bacterium]|nr:MAG: hypothetical protein D4R64_02910 [Porphyromonadaceae bacterium]
MIERFRSIFEAINTILSVLAPPIAVVFLIDFPAFGHVKVITQTLGIPYMMQGWWLFVFLSSLFVVVSLLTPKPDYEKIKAYTLDKPLNFLLKGKVTGIGDPRILSLILVVIMIIFYSIFS